ncbi:acyltransferase family protein [Pseudonocardia sp. GCM10023141]|uniref:acyltransferase family protein n=1 Tax=Pseudonocardia sp. GCM10023141 TaxID=3252653 RepID=UPI00362432C5
MITGAATPGIDTAEPRLRRRLADFPARHNSLNALRLALAVLVIVSHAWPLGGFGRDPHLGRFTLGEIAVAGFFTISGWLITQSRLSGGLGGYLWRRLVRIYPGYLAALIVVAFVVAPIGAKLSSGTYGWRDGVRHVLVNLGLLINDYAVGTSLPSTAFPAWNGSLWTLFSEAVCYVVIGLLVSLVPRRAVAAVVVLAFVGFTLGHLILLGPGTALPFWLNDGLMLYPFFFAGATLYVLRRHVPLHAATAAVALALLALVMVTSAPNGLGALPVAYLAMWLGAVLPLQKVGSRNDISYGMYIYAFPAQQLLAIAGATAWGVTPYLLLGIVATVPAAVASWFLVERPAQRARHWFDRPADSAPRAARA